MNSQNYRSSAPIASVGVTSDTLTGRGGLAVIVQYFHAIGVIRLLEKHFGHLRTSGKGLPVGDFFFQVLCWLFDGTSRHLVYFDKLKSDPGYAAIIETTCEELASSHQIKRFFQLFGNFAIGPFRQILHRLFRWRLNLETRTLIELTIDSMVMDNDSATHRHGVQPTYKKVKGFHPLHLIWHGMIVDAIFRGGKKHGNAGNAVLNMIRTNVRIIREALGEDIPIVIRLESGFFDRRILELLDELNVAFIVSGKMYQAVKDIVAGTDQADWQVFENEHLKWQFAEFHWGCKSWPSTYRTLYTRAMYEGRQMLLDFERPDNVILTNIEPDAKCLKHWPESLRSEWLKGTRIIASHHGRGVDELPHRGLKDFGFQELPFKRFAPNAAVYYCMLIGFLVFESFKRDTLSDVIPIVSYATRVRRELFDIAAKIVRSAKRTVLKVTEAVMIRLDFGSLWARSREPSAIPIA